MNSIQALVRRRGVLLAAAAVPLAMLTLQAASKPFWEESDPKDWTAAQSEELLTHSPWAAEAHVSVFSGPGGESGLPRTDPFGVGNGRSNGGRSETASGNIGRKGGRGTAKTTPSDPGKFHAIARWESARPILAAAKTRHQDASQFYIVAVMGDLPDLSGGDDDQAARQQRSQMMREATKLERKGESPIYLDHLESVNGGDLFYFSRLEPIKPSNKDITFSTRLGPIEIKVKFSLKDMMYRGKLEL